MKTLLCTYIAAAAIICFFDSTCPVNAMPAALDEATGKPEVKTDEKLATRAQNDSSTTTTTTTMVPALSITEMTTSTTPATDLEASGSEQQEQTIPPNSIEPMASENVAAPSNIDPAVYGGGILSPEAFQQYISQFGGAYPYGPAPYPAPIYPGFAPLPPPPPPSVYPSPYVVETGYDGYLVPSPNHSTALTKPVDAQTSATHALKNPLTILGNLISAIMMSTFFRVLATIASALGMIFFSGQIVNIICTYTSICDVSNRAVTFFRRRSNTNVGRMIAEEITPERVRRAAEFVRNAIDKYHKLQQLMGEVTNDKKYK